MNKKLLICAILGLLSTSLASMNFRASQKTLMMSQQEKTDASGNFRITQKPPAFMETESKALGMSASLRKL